MLLICVSKTSFVTKLAVLSPRSHLSFVFIEKQSMASGVAGLCGQPVQSHVVKENKREAVPVQIPVQPMEENNVLAKLKRRRIVMLSLAQVCNGVYEVYFLAAIVRGVDK